MMEKLFRSQRLLDRDRSSLVVVDVQTSLTPLVQNHAKLVWNISRLIRSAVELDVQVQATEQYPKGLKGTVAPLATLLPQRHEKLAFSVAGVSKLVEQFNAAARSQIVLCGIETHICILQSAMDLLAAGYDVIVVADAVAARRIEDHAVALRRMADEGVQVVTTESVIFEWCQTAEHPAFKRISAIVREAMPEGTEQPNG